MSQKARYRYRIYPTEAQKAMLARTFGCCRVVYNDFLGEWERAYRAGEKRRYAEIASIVTAQAKRTPERAWLAEVSSVALAQSCRDAMFACLRWHRRRAQRPTFHKKRSRQSFRVLDNAFSFRGDRLYVAKVGDIKVRWSRALPSIPKSVSIIRESDGRYYASFVVDVPLELWPENDRSSGVDLGLANFATVVGSDGANVIFENPRFLRAAERRLARAQRALSRKQKGSKNREKARVRVAIGHRKVRNKRLDQHHKVACWLIRENQAVAIEDLNIAGLARTRLAKSIRDAGWAQFIRILNEKVELHGRRVVKISRWAPTTRACSSCGANEGAKPLDVRAWTCGVCGASHDRDLNAALNILVAAGLAETSSARGAGVRPRSSAAVGDEAGTALSAEANCLIAPALSGVAGVLTEEEK